MNHPSHDELVDFLDGETAGQRQTEVARHVEVCGECGARIAAWRGAQAALRSWELVERPRVQLSTRRVTVRQQLVRIAAAVVLLVTGFSLARITAPAPDLTELRADLAEQLGGELRNEISAELMNFAAAQSANQQSMIHAVQELDARWLADFGSLRRDVETVAVRTQEEFARLSSSAP